MLEADVDYGAGHYQAALAASLLYSLTVLLLCWTCVLDHIIIQLTFQIHKILQATIFIFILAEFIA